MREVVFLELSMIDKIDDTKKLQLFAIFMGQVLYAKNPEVKITQISTELLLFEIDDKTLEIPVQMYKLFCDMYLSWGRN